MPYDWLGLNPPLPLSRDIASIRYPIFSRLSFLSSQTGIIIAPVSTGLHDNLMGKVMSKGLAQCLAFSIRSGSFSCHCLACHSLA